MHIETMRTYVAEVAGEALIAFRAKDEVEAEFMVEKESGISDVLSEVDGANGGLLWDGKAEIVIRLATSAEHTR
jgi:hypothetical protein